MEINPLYPQPPIAPAIPQDNIAANVEDLAKTIEKFKQMIEQILQNTQLSKDPYQLSEFAKTVVQLNILSEAAQK